MSYFSGITDVEAYHNPNEGRVIINENFRKMISGVTDSVNSISGVTSVVNSIFTSGSTGMYSIKAINDSGLNATADYAYAEGNGTLASGSSSHAEGAITIAGGIYSHAEGYRSIASGDYSHAEGLGGYSSGHSSHSEGVRSTSSGEASHAEGYYSNAIGFGSHAEGGGKIGAIIYSGGTSFGIASHSEGILTIASGISSHSEGILTKAIGNYSHAGGSESIASGVSSFIHSTNSLVTGDRSVVLGGENITGVTDDTVYVPNLNISTTPASGSSSDKILTRSSDGTIRTIDQPLYEYRANLTQSSTNAPSATTLGSVTLTGGSWSYSSTGSYFFTRTGAFSATSNVEVEISNAQIFAYPMTNFAFNLISASVYSDDIIEVRTSKWYVYAQLSGGPTDSMFVSPGNGGSVVTEAMSDDILSNTRFCVRVWS